MTMLFVRHDVSDFGAWKKAYDAFDAERRSMGVLDDSVYRADGDPNDVTVLHEFANHEAAEIFVASSRLREVMQDAGVRGEPTVWFTTPA